MAKSKWDKKNNWIFIDINGGLFQVRVSKDDLLKCLDDSVLDEDFIDLIVESIIQRSEKTRKEIINLLQENQ